MTRADMEKIIREGGSVLHQGRHIASAADLPSEAELSKGNDAEQDRLLASYDEQIKSLQGKKQAIFDAREKAVAESHATPQKAQDKPAEDKGDAKPTKAGAAHDKPGK